MIRIYNPWGTEWYGHLDDYEAIINRFMSHGQGWSLSYAAPGWEYREVVFYRDNVMLFSKPKLRDVSTCHELMNKAKQRDILCVLVDDVRDIPETLDAEIDFLLTMKGREP